MNNSKKGIYELVRKINNPFITKTTLLKQIPEIMTDINGADFLIFICGKYIYKNKDILKTVINNLSKIDFTSTSSYQLLYTLSSKIDDKTLLYNDDLYRVLESKNIEINESTYFFEQVDDKYLHDFLSYALSNWTNGDYINEIVKEALKYHYDDIVINNINRILPITSDIFKLNIITKANPIINDEVKKEIYKNKKRYVNDLLYGTLSNDYDLNLCKSNDEISDPSRPMTSLEDEKITDFVSLVVEELAENENVAITDIKPIGSGAFSSVYQVGNKVLKLGRKRATFKFPDNPYINRPLLRKEIMTNDGSKSLLVIEISELLKTDNITDEDVYQIYKKLRDMNLICTDLRKDNLGRLIKQNNIFWNTPLSPDSEALGLEPSLNNTVLGAGEVVLIDADFIRKEKSDKYASTSSYETRYQHERESKSL